MACSLNLEYLLPQVLDTIPCIGCLLLQKLILDFLTLYHTSMFVGWTANEQVVNMWLIFNCSVVSECNSIP